MTELPPAAHMTALELARAVSAAATTAECVELDGVHHYSMDQHNAYLLGMLAAKVMQEHGDTLP